MVRGRKPLPKAMRELNGRKCDYDEPEARPILRSTPPPSHLPPEGKAEWKRLMKESPKNVLTHADLGSLAVYCRTFADWLEAIRQMDATGGQVVLVNAVPQRSPWHLVSTRLADQLGKLASELALLPASRARLRLPIGEQNDEADELALFLADQRELSPRLLEKRKWMEMAADDKCAVRGKHLGRVKREADAIKKAQAKERTKE
jgi:P27 family predicted phage terminase small subunit